MLRPAVLCHAVLLPGYSPAAVTGKPLGLHGSQGRDSAAGRGVAIAAREFMRACLSSRVKGSTFVIQASERAVASSLNCNCRNWPFYHRESLP